MITMRTVMAEAGTVTTTTQRGPIPIVRRTRGHRYQARARPNNRKPRRHRRRRRSHSAASIRREKRKGAPKSYRMFPLCFSQILPSDSRPKMCKRFLTSWVWGEKKFLILKILWNAFTKEISFDNQIKNVVKFFYTNVSVKSFRFLKL